MFNIGKKNRDSIVINKDQLEVFKENLEKIYSSCKDKGTIEKPQEFNKKVIKKIEELKQYFLDKLERKMDPASFLEFQKGMDELYSDFYHNFENKITLLEYFSKETDKYFFLRKMYQLCHCYGVFNDDIWGAKNIPENVKKYFYLYLFLDFFESFSKFIQPMIKTIWLAKTGHIWFGRYRLREIYRIWLNDKHLKYSIGIKYKDLDDNYCELRNDIAHGTVLIYDDNLVLRTKYKEKKNRDKMRVKPINELIDEFETFFNIAIIYSTEFDLRMLELSQREDINKFFGEWMKYFKVYNESWQKIGNY